MKNYAVLLTALIISSAIQANTAVVTVSATPVQQTSAQQSETYEQLKKMYPATGKVCIIDKALLQKRMKTAWDNNDDNLLHNIVASSIQEPQPEKVPFWKNSKIQTAVLIAGFFVFNMWVQRRTQASRMSGSNSAPATPATSRSRGSRRSPA